MNSTVAFITVLAHLLQSQHLQHHPRQAMGRFLRTAQEHLLESSLNKLSTGKYFHKQSQLLHCKLTITLARHAKV